MAVLTALLSAALLPAHGTPEHQENVRTGPHFSVSLAVDPQQVVDHVSDHMYGSGIETYNHCMYGGLWSNLLYDDSVEDAATGAVQRSH